MVELKITNMKKSFGDKFSLQNINLTLKSGDLFVYIGPNGAGKTTTVRCLLNLYKLDNGSIYYQKNKKPLKREKIGFVLEKEKPYDELTSIEYLSLFGNIYGVKGINEKIKEVLKNVNLNEDKNKRIKSFSKGMKKKLILAKALISEPNILILDEPLEGLEVETRREIKDILKEEVLKGSIIFITTHNLFEAENFCNIFGIIDNGKLLGKWDISDLDCSLEEFYLNRKKNEIV